MKGKLVVRTVIVIVLCVLAIAGCVWGYRYYCRETEKSNHDKIKAYIDGELTFESEMLVEQEAVLQAWIHTPHVADADLGLLYERLSNIYKFQGRIIDYYETLGVALYYLDKGGNINTAANIYADLANYYVVNNSYERAQEMMDEIYRLTDVDQMEDLQIRSYTYRMQAVLDIHEGKYESAKVLLQKSRDVVDMSNTNLWENAYYGMIDMQRARVFFEMGDYAGAQKIIDDYANSPMFTDVVFVDIMTRDFVIPYYEVACRLAARMQDQSVAKPLIDAFVARCEEYGFYKSELDTLLYLLEYLPPETEEEVEEIYEIINRAYLVQTDMQTDEYTGLINGQLMEAIAQKEQENVRAIEHQHRVYRMLLSISVIVVILVLLLVTIRQSRTDGLTGIQNRKAFNQHMRYLKKTHAEYGIIMMDIDNFKHVNDTYGHPTGDVVLQKLALILKSVQNRAFKCYRYGGEEFVLISMDTDVQTMVAAAERVRKEMAALVWDFGETITISLGVAISRDDLIDRSVIDAADQNLYYSKEHGKNTVSYCKDGTVCTTKE